MTTKRYLPALLVVTLIGTIMELDMSVPSFPDIARDFGASASAVQLTITCNFFGYCLGALVHGPLSDRFGRRTVMLAGNTLMLAGALGCTIAPHMEFLLASRLVQGIGASTSVVLVFVIIGDVYQGTRLFQMLGLTNAAMSAFMTAAPALGGIVNRTLGWRGNYATVFGITLVSLLLMAFFLPETGGAPVKAGVRQVAADFRKLLTSKAFLAASLVPSLLFAAYMVFIAASSFLYTGTFGLSTVGFAGHLLIIVASFSVTSLLASKLIGVLGGPERTVVCGIALTVVGTALFLAFGRGPWATTGPLALFCAGFATVYPVIFGRSMGLHPELQGAAASLNMSGRALLVTLFTGVAGSLFTGTSRATAGVMAVAVAVAALLAFVRPSPARDRTAAEPVTETG
ncbi:drug transporter [Streptomyces lydicamycinicus]|uniref:Drug transporter n=1 Tax=Streptomyces lydicamycinicus TaxID=1546107 RepID=A0A0P4RE60_9ACTN|nr:MFS transporter [Streptomyces lydicamycinicus]GAO11542.1 drug transporter [Streptomyces lydicamycinicus]